MSAGRTALFALAVLGLAEATTRLALSQPSVYQNLHRFGEAGHRVAVLEKLIDEPLEASQGTLAGRPLVHHPVLGWVGRPGPHLVRGDAVSINALGFRGPEVRPTPTRPRVVLLGDSFTWGDEVADGETYAALLARALPDHEIVDLGMLGYGHDQMLLAWREVGASLGASTAVIGFTSCDVPRDSEHFNSYAKPWFTLEDGALVLHGTPVPAPEALTAAYRGSPRLLDLGAMWAAALHTGSPVQDHPLAEALVGTLADEIGASGAEAVLAYLPIPFEYEGTQDPTTTRLHGIYERVCQGRPVRCLDLAPVFVEAHARGVDLTGDAHWSPAGHALVAEHLAPFLASESP